MQPFRAASAAFVGVLLSGGRSENLLDGNEQEVHAVAVGELQNDSLGLLIAGNDGADDSAGCHHFSPDDGTGVGLLLGLTSLAAASEGHEYQQKQHADHDEHQDAAPDWLTHCIAGLDLGQKSVNHNGQD